MNIPPPSRDQLPVSYRPTPPKVVPYPLLPAPIDENPDRLGDPDPPPGTAQSSPGSHLSGSGYSLAPSPGLDPWVEAVRVYFEDLRQGDWTHVLRRAGCHGDQIARLAGLRKRLGIQLQDFTLADAGPPDPERARVTVFENLLSGQRELARAATFRVERVDGKWRIQDVEGWRIELSQLDEYLLWTRLTGTFPLPMLEHGLGAVLWFLGKLACDPRVGLWCWSTRLAHIAWLTLPLQRSAARWRAPLTGGDLLAWVEARMTQMPR